MLFVMMRAALGSNWMGTTMNRKYVLGLDYGTESGRALLVAADNGEEVATAVEPYAHGVIDDTLPGRADLLKILVTSLGASAARDKILQVGCGVSDTAADFEKIRPAPGPAPAAHGRHLQTKALRGFVLG